MAENAAKDPTEEVVKPTENLEIGEDSSLDTNQGTLSSDANVKHLAEEEEIVPLKLDSNIGQKDPSEEELDDDFNISDEQDAIEGNQRSTFQPGCYIIRLKSYRPIKESKDVKKHIVCVFENVANGDLHEESFYVSSDNATKISTGRIRDMVKFAGMQTELDKLKASGASKNLLANLNLIVGKPFKAIFRGVEAKGKKNNIILNVNLGKMAFENSPLEYNPTTDYTKYTPNTNLGGDLGGDLGADLEKLPDEVNGMPQGNGLFNANQEAFPEQELDDNGNPVVPF